MYEDSDRTKYFGAYTEKVMLTEFDNKLRVEVTTDTHLFTYEFEALNNVMVKTRSIGEPL